MENELKEHEKWMQKAESDLRIVEKDLATVAPVTDVLCFHCQQAAEKYLKAFLVYKGNVPERTHLIERLIQSCMVFDPDFEQLKDATLLTEYAVAVRYPDDMYVPDIEETGTALQLALSVKNMVHKKIL